MDTEAQKFIPRALMAVLLRAKPTTSRDGESTAVISNISSCSVIRHIQVIPSRREDRINFILNN